MDSETNSPSYMQGQDSSGNPAWNDFFEVVPEEYHQALTPVLTNWDKGVNERFSKIHEDYAPFKGVDKEQFEFAMSLADRVENEPLEIYNALHEYLSEQGLLESLGQGDDDDAAVEEDKGNFDPRYSKLEQGFQTLAEAYLHQEQLKAEAEEDAALEAELDDMREKYGDFDEEFVLSKMVNGMDTEEAVQAYVQFVDKLASQMGRPAPRIVGSAGAFPGQGTVNPSKLNQTQREDLVADYLRSMNQ